MREETKCPHCGAKERGDYIPGVNMLWWECGNNEDLIERGSLYPDQCRIRAMDNKYGKLYCAWIGLTTELHLCDNGDFEEGDVSAIISRWEAEAYE